MGNAERDANKALADEARHLRKLVPKKVSIEPLVVRSAAAKEIGARATELRADLIVMGRARVRALHDAFLGSTAERVIRQTRLPVLSVRLAPRRAYRRPALALDLDSAAPEAILLMLRVLPPPRPQVAIIHAVVDPYQGPIYSTISDDEAEERKDEVCSNATRKLELLLATALAKAKVRFEDGPIWKPHIRCGSPRIVVEKVVKKAESDLLVIGTHGYSAAAHAFLGSVAGDVLRATKCDVLIVPPARRG